MRSPVLHRVYARMEKPVADWIVYRGDRPLCPEVKPGDRPIKALRSLYPQSLGVRVRSLLMS
jgi:hypothetical protein